MDHLAEGTLLAFLDDELSHGERTAAERHLERCDACAAALEELRTAAAGLEAALALLDPPAPAAGPSARVLHLPRRRPASSGLLSTRRAFLRAAMLVLGFAAAASAALPSSPVHRWAAAAWRQGVALLARDRVEPVEPQQEAAAPEAGVSIRPVDGRIRIVVESPAPGVRVRARLVDGDRVSVYAYGAAATARFRTSPGRVDVVGPGGGELRVDLPTTLLSAVLEADGRILVSKEGASLEAAGAAAGGSSTEVVVPLSGHGSTR